jgi:putative sugar O-methyltransferase
MLEDTQKQSALWRPANYWKPYCKRIIDEIERVGLSNFRTNIKILKGYAAGGPPEPALPQAEWKRAIWHGLENAPVISGIVKAHKKITRASHNHRIATQIALAKACLDDIADRFPDFRPPEGICNGNPEDAFVWRGHRVSSDWVMLLTRVADFYETINPAQVKSILEIGPGLGLSSLAHIALNPHLKTIVNVDIVPIIYVSTQYLKGCPQLRVIDYSQAKDMPEIAADTLKDDKTIVYQLPTWELSKVRGPIDFFFNAYSFMEMEKEICSNYAKIVSDTVTGGVCVHSHLRGHAVGAGNQKEPVTHDFIAGLFKENFEQVAPETYFWAKYGLGLPEELSLMIRNHRHLS